MVMEKYFVKSVGTLIIAYLIFHRENKISLVIDLCHP